MDWRFDAMEGFGDCLHTMSAGGCAFPYNDADRDERMLQTILNLSNSPEPGEMFLELVSRNEFPERRPS